ncbi:MAG: polysaccharide pyruvyl transferase family protein [Chloroflexi bacterium]|jgi:polysaccharide pyruvyl transferase WcaK-like protein|nr:polysaccharide pyruvyl transferase family protein [Chloroflexota bacterium]
MAGRQYAVMGGSVWGNRGAEAMLMTVIAEIRKFDPDALFNVFTIYPKKDRTLVKDENIRFLSGAPLAVAINHLAWSLLAAPFRLLGIKIPLPKSVRALRGSDFLLDIGGITFSDGRALQLLYNVFTIWPAMLLGVPVIKLSQALGPFQTNLNRKLATHFLPRCEHIFTRGYLSNGFVQGLPKLEGKVEQAADIAFLFEPEYSLSQENEEKAANMRAKIIEWKRAGERVISIVPSSLVLKRSLKQGFDYPGKLLNLCLDTRDKAFRYVFLPNGTREGSEKTMNNDIIAINLIRDKFRDELSSEVFERIEWVDYDINTRGVREIIGASDGLVASRFHAMVAGLSLCVPTMVIGWSHKYRETLADFGMETYAIDYKNTDLNLLKAYRTFIDNLETTRAQLQSRIDTVKTSSASQFEYLRRISIG